MELMEGPPEPSDWKLDGGRDQVVVLRNVSWEQYDAIDAARGDASQPLLAYLDGELEIVTTSQHHEWLKKLLSRLIEAYAEERGLRLDGFGHATLREEAKRAGIEPDEWYKTDARSEVPDLAIEIVLTSGGVDKLEIYRRFHVREVWFWVNGKIWVYHLVGRRYEARTESVVLPDIDFNGLERMIGASDEETDQTAAVRAYRESLKR